MFSNITNILDSLDNVAKDITEDDAPSATWVRSQQRRSQEGTQDEMDGMGTERKTDNIKRDLRNEMSVVGKDEILDRGPEIDLTKRVAGH